MSTETEILREVEALKGRFSDTKALYREVCALLFFRFGITPTTNKLYQYVRKGTMSTPAEALTKFWDDLRSKARVEVDHPDLPDEIKAVAAEAIAAVWRQATAAARGELASIRVELQADRERMVLEQEQAKRAAADAAAHVSQLEVALATATSATSEVRVELEAERRAHAGTAARLHELQAQLEQMRTQQKHLQESFSAGLAKAREAVDVADRRASAAEKRALLEIEQERQARSKADKLLEGVRAQSADADAKARAAGLEHAQTLARVQAELAGAGHTGKELRAANERLERELHALRERLEDSRQEAIRYRTEAQTIQSLLDRLTIEPLVPPPTKGRRAKKVA